MRKIVIALLLLCLLALCLTGCQQKSVEKNTAASTSELAQKIVLDDYLASVREQSDAIQASLENDPLTQTELNQKSQELRELWEAALNTLLNEAKKALSEAEMDALTAEQTAWLEAMEKTVQAAGKEFEGGSIYALVVNSEAAALTEARVYELYEKLK